MNLKKLILVEVLFASFIGLVAAGNQVVVHHGLPEWRKVYRMHPGTTVLLNNLDLTPGIVRTTNRADVCDQPAGWTDPLRKPGDPTVFKLYGVDPQKPLPGDPIAGTPKKPLYEIDHLISLELGGDNGVKNEWPQPYYEHPGAHEKDAVENYLHKQVCSGAMALTDAQKQIANDWFAVYLRIHGQN